MVSAAIQRLLLVAANLLVHRAVGTVEALLPLFLVDSVRARESFFLLVLLGFDMFGGELVLEAGLGVVETKLRLVVEIGEGSWGIGDYFVLVAGQGWVAGGVASVPIGARHVAGRKMISPKSTSPGQPHQNAVGLGRLIYRRALRLSHTLSKQR